MTAPTGRFPHTKQRNIVAMSPHEVDAFLAGRRTVVLSTLTAAGDIHSVAMWYWWADGVVHMTSKARAQKVRNIERAPRATCFAESGDRYDQLMGVSLAGHATIVDDPATLRSVVTHLLERYESGNAHRDEAQIAASMYNRVVIRVEATRVTSWDHRKLGL